MIAANNNVTLNAPISIGANQTWAVGLNSPGNTLTDSDNLSGSATLTKAGYGTLVLNGSNNFSGALNVDSGSSTADDGVIKITASTAIASVASPISIRDTGTGQSTFQLDGTLGGVTVPQTISLAGRNTNVVAIENLAGSNVLAGGIILATGGTNYLLRSDAGTLNLGGTISAGGTATGARILTFQGNGNFYLSGAIQNGSASPFNAIKTGSGALTLSGANTYTGTTTVAGGTLAGNGSLAGATTIQSGGTLEPGNTNLIGTLAFGSSLTLASGSKTVMEIKDALQTNDQLQVTGTLTCGGTLMVTNLGGTPAPGDSFKLFNAGSYNGSFATLVLPPLTGFNWNTNGLTNGILSITATTPETIVITNLGLNQLQVNWSSGTLQTAMNVTGPYNDITNVTAPYTIPATNAQQFYRVRVN